MPQTERESSGGLTATLRGGWFAASEYELDHGYISPRAGAAIRRYELEEGTFLEVLELSNRLRWRWVGGGLSGLPWGMQLDSASVDELLRWCSRFGLFGLLEQEFELLQFPTLWLRDLDRLGDEKTHIAIQEVVVLDSSTSEGFRTEQRRIEGVVPRTDVTSGQPVATEHLPDRTYAETRSISRDARTGQPRLSDGEEWRRYFRVQKDEASAYPSLRDLVSHIKREGYWQTYREPLNEFLRMLQAFRGLADQVGLVSPDGSPSGEPNPGLERLAGPQQLHWSRDRGLEMHSRSLIGYCAVELLAHLSNSRRRVVLCRNCGRMLTPNRRSQRYCSARCRQTAEKRRQRARRQGDRPENGDG